MGRLPQSSSAVKPDGRTVDPRRASDPLTLGSAGVAAVVLIIPLMQGGLVTATLPVLCLLVGLAFLAESRRFLFHERGTWREAAPWIWVWLGVSLYIFGQPAVREIFGLELTINGIDFTRVYWLQHVKYWSFFTAYWLLAWVVTRQRARAKALIVIAVMAMALFQSLYGTLAFVNGQETILGIWPKEQGGDSVAGTFYNRNHLAGFLAVAMPLGAAYLMSERWAVNVQRLQLVKLFATIVFLLVAGAALIGTASRLGIFSALIGLLLWAWLHTRAQQAAPRWQYIWPGALVALPLLAGLWFGPQHLIERLFQLDQAAARLSIWTAMLDVPAAVWWQGIGAGSFHDVFKLIHPAEFSRSVWSAHSEYLQLAFEFGLVGLALLTPLAVYWVKQCRPRQLGSLQRGALAGIVAILIHNIAEFDMQVPGTAVVFWTALGILFSRPRQHRGRAP